ncbi:MAG: phosphoribosylglycinamide formyltransferase [Syntrophobacteraceae bacterium]
MAQAVGKLKIAVLISGGGTNLQALIDRAAEGSLAAEIVVVASDRPEAYGLERARAAGIPAHVVDYKAHGSRSSLVEASAQALPVDLDELDKRQRILKQPDREARLRRLRSLVLAEHEMIGVLDRYQPDLICLAGFMRLVSPYFLGRYNRAGQWRVLNIHPALLPAFPGQHGYEDTFDYGCKWGGITVHFVDEGEDTGPIVAQAVYPVWPDDDVEKVRTRGLQLEYDIYAQCINWFAAGQISINQKENMNRMSALILDPSYPDIIQKWMGKAISRA